MLFAISLPSCAHARNDAVFAALAEKDTTIQVEVLFELFFCSNMATGLLLFTFLVPGGLHGIPIAIELNSAKIEPFCNVNGGR